MQLVHCAPSSDYGERKRGQILKANRSAFVVLSGAPSHWSADQWAHQMKRLNGTCTRLCLCPDQWGVSALSFTTELIWGKLWLADCAWVPWMHKNNISCFYRHIMCFCVALADSAVSVLVRGDRCWGSYQTLRHCLCMCLTGTEVRWGILRLLRFRDDQ